MDWFQSKAAQIIALVSIIGTLAGFGYTGATYINRLENLENKIGGVDEAEDSQKVIEERFAGLEAKVDSYEKLYDESQEGVSESFKSQSMRIVELEAQVQNLLIKLENVGDEQKVNDLEKQVEKNLDSIEDLEDDIEELKDSNKNPLSG
tara:strand:- start:1 stop:447 length:447 start_codon:yes stop_codon:yes gene_type:complete